MTERLSDHFTAHEAACPCCGMLTVNRTLVGCLERLREMCGNVPVRVTSWCRCKAWNELVGGVPASQHTLGRAVDIVVQGMDPIEVAEIANRIGEFSHGGIGIYETFVHLDVRTTGPARWTG